MGGRVAHNGEARVGCGLGRLVWQPTSVCQPTGRGADREKDVSGYDSDLGDLCIWAMLTSPGIGKVAISSRCPKCGGCRQR